MRGCFVAIDEGKMPAYGRACFEAYWRDDKDLSKPEVLGPVAASAGLEESAFLAAINDDEIKQRLFAGTDEAIARGVFGSPTFFVNGDDMYFGNDRLELIRFALSRAA